MGTKVEYTFDPIGLVGEDPEEYTDDAKRQIQSAVSDFVKSQVIDDALSQISSVDGSKWDPLSPEYRKHKKAIGGKPIANLTLSGDYLSAFKVIKRKDSTLTLTVDSDQQGKADGHNNHSGESKLPLRRSIPSADDGDTFRDEILSGIKEIVVNSKDASKAELKDQATQLKDDLKTTIKDLGYSVAKGE